MTDSDDEVQKTLTGVVSRMSRADFALLERLEIDCATLIQKYDGASLLGRPFNTVGALFGAVVGIGLRCGYSEMELVALVNNVYRTNEETSRVADKRLDDLTLRVVSKE